MSSWNICDSQIGYDATAIALSRLPFPHAAARAIRTATNKIPLYNASYQHTPDRNAQAVFDHGVDRLSGNSNTFKSPETIAMNM